MFGTGKLTQKRLKDGMNKTADALELAGKDIISTDAASKMIVEGHRDAYDAGYDDGYITAYACAGISSILVAAILHKLDKKKYGK